MKIDTSLWNNTERMRIRMKNFGTSIMSLSAVNGFISLNNQDWIIFGINCLFFITTLPLFISYSKWEKEPPRELEK